MEVIIDSLHSCVAELMPQIVKDWVILLMTYLVASRTAIQKLLPWQGDPMS